MEIVPARDRLIVEGRVQPVDIDNVMVGQRADVSFTAFTPILEGKVIYISANSVRDERSGQSYYVVRIAVSKVELSRLGKKRIQSGTPAEIMIQTGERTSIGYLVQPMRESLRCAWCEQ